MYDPKVIIVKYVKFLASDPMSVSKFYAQKVFVRALSFVRAMYIDGPAT